MLQKVLWIDDEPNEFFVNEARELGLDVKEARCYEDGYRMLTDETINYSAIILDVKCKFKNGAEAITMDAYREYFVKITSYCEQVNKRLIPWFVYTAGGDDVVDGLKFMLPKNKDWDDIQYYDKSTDYELLLSHIIQAIQLSPLFQIRQKYEDVLTICPDKVSELERTMCAITKEDHKNASVFNDMRKVLGWQIEQFRQIGFFPNEVRTLRNASYYLKEICKQDCQLVPSYIYRTFALVEEATQNASHGENEWSGDGCNNLIVDSDVKDGRAPYLMNCIFYGLLTIIRWFGGLSKDPCDVEERRRKVYAMNISLDTNRSKMVESEPLKEVDVSVSYDEFEGKVFVLEKDENDNLHCGFCLVGYQNNLDKIGKMVRLTNVVENSNSKGNCKVYSCFAKHVKLIE